MRSTIALLCSGLLLAGPAGAEPPPASESQLRQVDQASEQQLQRMQRPPGFLGADQRIDRQRTRHRLDRQQQRAQRQLQESQRRQLQLFNQRARTLPPGAVPPALQGIQMQRQFRLQQQYQLDRFRLQR